jgi:hypothetical protein
MPDGDPQKGEWWRGKATGQLVKIRDRATFGDVASMPYTAVVYREKRSKRVWVMAESRFRVLYERITEVSGAPALTITAKSVVGGGTISSEPTTVTIPPLIEQLRPPTDTELFAGGWRYSPDKALWQRRLPSGALETYDPEQDTWSWGVSRTSGPKPSD